MSFDFIMKNASSIGSAGPFGGHGGDPWDDGVHTTVRQLIIFTSTVVESIEVEYDDVGHSEWSDTHGNRQGVKHFVKLDYPGEFLHSVSGHYSESETICIRSLTFESNRSIYGPFGIEEGNSFKLPTTDSKIIGFFGRSGQHFNSIGAYYAPIPDPSFLESVVGPFGGQGGSPWNDGVHTTVRQIIVYSSFCIESVKIEYDDKGRSNWCLTHGSEHGTKSVVKLQYPGEFLISISGYYTDPVSISGNDPDRKFVLVRSLIIKTNIRTYGPIGPDGGNYFEFPPMGSKIIGFHGNSGLWLDSIGAYYEPIADPSNVFSAGPIGGNGEDSWDDGPHTTVRKFIIYSSSIIESIQIEYDDKGRFKLAEMHGRQGGIKNTIKLEYPNEFILSISGYCTESEPIVVGSLTFETNKRTYGPFGQPKGDPFKVPSISGKIIGFHGSSGSIIDSIGVYFEPFA